VFLAGADFGGEGARGRKSVGGTGRKRVSFEFWHSAEAQNRPVPWPVEAPGSGNSTHSCIGRRSGVSFGSAESG
jgi:hypothetical protein